jgi:hypothetical protein
LVTLARDAYVLARICPVCRRPERERERECVCVCVCVLGAVLVTEGSGREGEDACKGLREARRYGIVCLPPEHKQGCSS